VLSSSMKKRSLSRFRRRNRLADHHDQTALGVLLGSRRYRGRSGHAGPTGECAHSASGRLPPVRSAPEG
jgi:hypothetical protein